MEFDWQTYLTIDVRNPLLREQIVTALDRIAQTPEGEQLIRQAA